MSRRHLGLASRLGQLGSVCRLDRLFHVRIAKGALHEPLHELTDPRVFNLPQELISPPGERGCIAAKECTHLLPVQARAGLPSAKSGSERTRRLHALHGQHRGQCSVFGRVRFLRGIELGGGAGNHRRPHVPVPVPGRNPPLPVIVLPPCVHSLEPVMRSCSRTRQELMERWCLLATDHDDAPEWWVAYTHGAPAALCCAWALTAAACGCSVGADRCRSCNVPW